MAEIKATENGLGIQADKITLEGPETEYVTLAARSAEKSTWTRDLKASRGTLPKSGSGQGTYLPKHHTKSEILTCICCC